MSLPAPKSPRPPAVADAIPAGPPSPSRTVGRSWTAGPVPLGLDRPLDLRGGDRMPPGGMPATLPLDWCPDLLDLIAEECRRRLAEGRPWFGTEPLAFVGGGAFLQRHVGTMIALHSGVPLVRIDAGGGPAGLGLRAAAGRPEVALPSRLVLHMAAARCANPVVLVEGATSSCGEALTALTSMIDSRTANRWVEDAVGATVDLSHVTWLIAVDRVDALPLPLERLLRPIHLNAGLSATGRELVLLSLVEEVAASFDVPSTRAAAGWDAIRADRSWSYNTDWAAVRKRVENALRS